MFERDAAVTRRVNIRCNNTSNIPIILFPKIKTHTHGFTFDQSLFWKASKIIDESEDRRLRDIILLLGTFHKNMNLIGCIGAFMDNLIFQKHLNKFTTKMPFSI